jgi:hypothetical protein
MMPISSMKQREAGKSEGCSRPSKIFHRVRHIGTERRVTGLGHVQAADIAISVTIGFHSHEVRKHAEQLNRSMQGISLARARALAAWR